MNPKTKWEKGTILESRWNPRTPEPLLSGSLSGARMHRGHRRPDFENRPSHRQLDLNETRPPSGGLVVSKSQIFSYHHSGIPSLVFSGRRKSTLSRDVFFARLSHSLSD
jgi:hypothetical protein